MKRLVMSSLLICSSQKKILARLEALDVSEDPVTYHQFLFKQMEAARQLDQQLFQNQLVLPDFEALALRAIQGVEKRDCACAGNARGIAHLVAVYRRTALMNRKKLKFCIR